MQTVDLLVSVSGPVELTARGGGPLCVPMPTYEVGYQSINNPWGSHSPSVGTLRPGYLPKKSSHLSIHARSIAPELSPSELFKLRGSSGGDYKRLLQSCACCDERERERVSEEEHRREVDEIQQRFETERRGRLVAEAKVSELARAFEQTREGRVDAYHRKALRKFANMHLSRGWQSFLTLYNDVLYSRSLMQQTKGKLFHLIPTVPSAFALWQMLATERRERQRGRASTSKEYEQQLAHDAEVAEREAERAALEAHLAAVEHANEALRMELKQVATHCHTLSATHYHRTHPVVADS